MNNGDIFTGNDTSEDYEVLKRIGQGGFGDTYLVARMSDGEEFVAKIPNKTDQRVIQCLINEYNVLKTLESKGVPYVVRAVEMSSFTDSFGTDHVLLIMEKAKGDTLEDIIRQSVLSFDNTLEIISKCAEGLQGIHDAGFIHRDIAPDNIIVDDVGGQNIVTIIDLGIAAAKAEKDTHVLVSMIAHKQFYSPPEQHKEQKVSIGNDIYSLGATVVSMLVGFDPQFNKHIGPLDLHNYITGIDEHFRQVIMKATWDTRAGRFATMQDMYDSLGGKIPDESMPRIIADGKTNLLKGDGPWIIGRGVDDVAHPPNFVPIKETSSSGTYIGRKHACIERRSDGVLLLYDGNREDGTPSKNGTKVLHRRWMDVPSPGFPLGKKFIEIALGYSNNPPPIKDKDGNILQPGPYKTIEFWPPQTSGTILPP